MRLLSDMEEKRSLPPTPERCPWLVFFAHGKHGKTQTFFSIARGKTYLRTVREMRTKNCLMVSQYGWLLMKEWMPGQDCFLLNPTSMETIHLPPLPPPSEYTSEPYGYRCILSSPPTDPNCVVCFFDKTKRSALFCHLIQKQWVKTEYDLPIFDGHDLIRDVVVCNGKVYGITMWDRLITIDFTPHPTPTVLDVAGRAKARFRAVNYSRALVESCGELYLVYKVYTGRTRVITTFRILKMDLLEMKWVAVDSIGNRAFFLSDGGRSFSCYASESGVERDSIYYVIFKDPCIYRFDVVDKSITRNHHLFRNLSCPWYEAYWVLPSSELSHV